jgi:hypothetical protein
VTNNDTAGCPASSFDLSLTLRDGWGSTLSAASLALAPGGSGAASLTVTSPFDTPDGSYAVSVSAANATVSGYSGAGSASYLVSSVGVALGAFSDSFDRPDSLELGSKGRRSRATWGTTANTGTTRSASGRQRGGADDAVGSDPGGLKRTSPPWTTTWARASASS